MTDLRLSSAAGEDLIEIRLYSLNEFGGPVADDYLRGFEKAFDRLRRHRSLYEINDDTLVVLRVIHSARRPSRTLLENSGE